MRDMLDDADGENGFGSPFTQGREGPRLALVCMYRGCHDGINLKYEELNLNHRSSFIRIIRTYLHGLAMGNMQNDLLPDELTS